MKNVKDDWLGGRVSSELKNLVETYIDEADISMGKLIRSAVQEYMHNHPVMPKINSTRLEKESVNDVFDYHNVDIKQINTLINALTALKISKENETE